MFADANESGISYYILILSEHYLGMCITVPSQHARHKSLIYSEHSYLASGSANYLLLLSRVRISMRIITRTLMLTRVPCVLKSSRSPS